MAIIESSLAVLSGTSGVASLHSWITGLKTGKQIDQILHEQKSIKEELVKINDHILMQPSVNHIGFKDSNKIGMVSDKNLIRDILIPLQKGLGEDIVTSAVLSSPAKMKRAFTANPWEVLINITPISYIIKNENKDFIPMFFSDAGMHYIGWQKKGVLPLVMGIEYRPEKNFETSKDNEFSVLKSFNNYIAPMYPDYPESLEKYQRWSSKNILVHNSLAETLIYDITLLLRQQLSINIDYLDNITLELVFDALDAYKNEEWRGIAGYLPWTITNFVSSLNEQDLENLGYEIYENIQKNGIPKSKWDL